MLPHFKGPGGIASFTQGRVENVTFLSLFIEVAFEAPVRMTLAGTGAGVAIIVTNKRLAVSVGKLLLVISEAGLGFKGWISFYLC